MNIFAEQVTSLLDAVAIGSGPDFTWLGVPDEIGYQPEQMDHDTLKEDVVRRLTWRIYQDFYCPGEIRPAKDPTRSADTWRAPMTGLLSKANSGAGQWSSGWRVVAKLEDGTDIVERNGLSLRVPADYVRTGTGSSVDTVSVRLPEEFPQYVAGPLFGPERHRLCDERFRLHHTNLLEPAP